MIIKRTLTESFRRSIDRQETEIFPIAFITLRHKSLTEPVRIVSNSENMIVAGNEYIGFEFSITILTDNDRPPRAQLEVQNVDRKIGAILLDIYDPPELELQIYSSDQFDESVIPHVAFDVDATFEYQALNLYLVDVSISGDTVSGVLKTWEYTQETYPSVFATEDRTPGLYW